MANADIRQLEMDGKVFYPQTDIHGLVNNGAFAIDDEPTQGSSNLVTSDSVYRIKSETLQENREMVDSVIQDYAPVEIHGDVTNAADEEDLTSVNISGTDVLKFKDKVYNQLVYSGMGKKILRKNIVNGVNTLTQSMINDENTIYIIQYDFVLGENITVPNNCILQFDGGSIRGSYTLTVIDTLINGLNCFENSIILNGACKNNEILIEWFIGTDLQKIQAAMDYAGRSIIKDTTTASTAYKVIYKCILFGNHKQYVIDNSINLPFYTNIEGNNSLIKITSSNNIMQTGSSGPWVCNIRNLTFMGDDVCALYLNVGNLENSFTTLSNLTFETDTKTSDKFGIYLYNVSSQCVIERCTARRCPNFLKVRCDSLIIRDCWINGYTIINNKALKPDNTCSIELSYGCRYTKIENCQLVPMGDGEGPYPKDIRWIDWKGGALSISNCIFGGENSGMPIIWKYTSNIHHTLSICDSQCAHHAASIYTGIVILMNNVLPGYIRLKNVYAPYTHFIEPYGYVKDNISDSNAYDNTAKQQAWDALVEKILENPARGIVGQIYVENITEYNRSYALFPYISDRKFAIINNPDITKTYVIANNLGNEPNVGGRVISVQAIFEILVSGTKGGYGFIAKYRFQYYCSKNYNLGRRTMTFLDKSGTNDGTIDIIDVIDVSLDVDFNLNISTTENEVVFRKIVYRFADYSEAQSPADGVADNFLYLLPQKFDVTIR